MISVSCTGCGLKILVPPTVQGRTGICFGCGTSVTVPITGDGLDLDDLHYAKGTRIADRYTIESPLGRGGMGVVYRAFDALIEEEVALKFMHPSTLRTQRGQQMFIKEAQVARRLRHENIVAVHDVSSTSEGVLYLSMEYLQGVSLRQFLRKRRSMRRLMEVRLAIELTLQVLAALEHAHRTVVHRDLKPENVMLLPGEKVKVLDFGLAIVAEEGDSHASGSKQVIGTTAYAAPEQKLHQSVDFRADLYTVGLLLHELLTLRTPIDEPVTVMGARTDVAPSIIQILDKALVPEKELRWQSAREFREALKSAYDESYRAITVTELQTEEGKTISTEKMVYFEGGSFLMGNDEVREEAPQFETHVDPFFLDTYPVTCEEYGTFLAATGHPEPKFWRDPELNGPRQPVTGVTWNDARAYAQWIGKDLPTEKQWEYAARGKENRPYPWGSLEPATTRCNYNDYLGMPSVVTMHDAGATPEGVFDMSGNVYEWTLDAFVPYNPKKNGGDNTQATAPRRVVRGGSWHSPANELRCSHRKGLFPESQLATAGFRCAVWARNLQG